jgi:hypothetical protein
MGVRTACIIIIIIIIIIKATKHCKFIAM